MKRSYSRIFFKTEEGKNKSIFSFSGWQFSRNKYDQQACKFGFQEKLNRCKKNKGMTKIRNFHVQILDNIEHIFIY